MNIKIKKANLDLAVDSNLTKVKYSVQTKNLPIQDATPLLDFHSTFSGNPLALHFRVTFSPVFLTTSFSPLCSNHGATKMRQDKYAKIGFVAC